MKRWILPALTALLLVTAAAVFAACGGDEGGQASKQKTAETRTAGTDSGAAELRTNLTALLQEHVYLAGTAISQGVGQGLDSKEYEAAAGSLDKNSVALSEAIGSVYGDDAGRQFLALWRDHIGFFVDYTKAKATKDARGAQAAKRKLDGYRAEFGAFLEGANPNLSKDAVAEEIKPHVDSVFATIDAVVAGSPQTFERLREAAGHMPGTANVLASAIVKQMPEKFSS